MNCLLNRGQYLEWIKLHGSRKEKKYLHDGQQYFVWLGFANSPNYLHEYFMDSYPYYLPNVNPFVSVLALKWEPQENYIVEISDELKSKIEKQGEFTVRIVDEIFGRDCSSIIISYSHVSYECPVLRIECIS